MTRERWSLLEPLVDAALDLAPDRRPAYYDEVAGNDPELRADLERLVGQSVDDDDLFSPVAAERFALLFDGARTPNLVADVLPQLQASLGAAYTIERELGGAGMSRVFLAHEAELGRRVVIKVLPPELAAGINAERFDREIKLAASLQQANIVPLLATGRAAGYPYYTMPFVEGRSLRDRLAREGVLPIGDALHLLRDVARALAYAHAQGVVHRDIKPGNVLLSGGTAVVTDFGIAKAISDASGVSAHPEGPTGPKDLLAGRDGTPALKTASDERQEPPASALTNAGSGIGTPPYMAPEQAAGDPNVDHRADIYAFGCLAYEVFTGKPPFHGDASHLIITAHLHETPRPVTDGRSDVPPAIAALVAQCLEKNPRRRPQSAAELLERLDTVSSGPTAPIPHRSPVTVLRGAVALAVVVGAAAYLVYLGTRPAVPNVDEPLTLAAVPFRTVSGDSALEYRAEDISEEILTAMGKDSGIRVVGRNAARQLRNRDMGERAVHRELGAVLLITGKYQERAGDSIVVSAQLDDSLAGDEVWSDTFRWAPGNRRSLADSMARAMTAALHGRYAGRIGEPKRGTLSMEGTTNLEARDLYAEGRWHLGRRRVAESVKSFEAAVRLDTSFAKAHAALAIALTFYPWNLGTPLAEVQDSIIHTANRALDLDPTLTDALSAIAIVHAGSGDWDKAATEFRRAIAVDPTGFDVHFNFGRISTIRGDIPEALRQFREARKAEQMSAVVSAWTSYAHFLQGQSSGSALRDSALEDSARTESALAVRLDPTLIAPMNLGALVNLGTGHLVDARRLIEAQRSNPMGTAAYGYAVLGDTAAAMNVVRQMESAKPRPPWSAEVQRATVMLAMGDSAGALTALEHSAQTTGPLWVWVISPRDPAFDLVRQSKRFTALVRQAGMDTAWVTARTRE